MRVVSIVLLVGLTSGCADEPPRGGAAGTVAGAAGEACYANGTCNVGLACASDRCVRLSTETLDAAMSDGVEGAAVDAAVSDTTMADLGEDRFSFFVTSLEAMRTLSGSQDGFGGDLGGLVGADTICQTIASGVGGGHKTWRAFLSVTQGDDGTPVNAIDRIGNGPWYDRNGRLLANNREGLLHVRPEADPQIADDLPNELGQPQRQFGDNHDVLTGSNELGQLNRTDPRSTCQDWTSAVGPGSEKQVIAGHSWPSSKSPGWIEAHTVPGCAPGVQLRQVGNGSDTDTVGGAGGYGALYCFALTP